MVTLGDITVDFSAGTLRDAAGSVVPLRAQSFAVLRHLAENAGRTVPKEALMSAVWNGAAVTDDSLVQCILDIRRVLGDETRALLRTVPRRGYRLDLPDTAPPEAPATRPGPPTLIVLPFTDISPDRSLEHLTIGITTDIISMLCRAGTVSVLTRAASLAQAGADRDLETIHRDLDADFVLDGTVRRDPDRLRVTVDLRDTEAGKLLLSTQLDHVGHDPLALQDEIAERVTAALTGETGLLLRAGHESVLARGSLGLGEYDWYLRGQQILARVLDRATNDRAGAIFEEGLRHHPGSDLLRVMLGWKHSLAAGLIWTDDPEADLRIAAGLVRDVLARTDLTPQVRHYAHWLHARVLFQEHDPESALAEGRLASRLAPNDAFMLFALAQVSAEAAQTEASRTWLERSRYLAPELDWLQMQTEANLFRLEGRNAEALACYERTERLPPYHRLIRAIVLMRLGRHDEARASVCALRDTAPTLTRTLWRASTRLSDPDILAGELADLAAAGLPS